MVFLTLRDPSHDVSVGVTCYRQVFDAVADVVSEGARVVVHCKPEWYAPRGQLSLRPPRSSGRGRGAAGAPRAAEEVLARGRGLFARSGRSRCRFLPRLIGLVCGRASAAERDVLEHAGTGGRRPLRGAQCARAGVHAVPQVSSREGAGRVDDVDVIIVARGGAVWRTCCRSLDEQLVRTVAACRTPVVSAIGHEPDKPAARPRGRPARLHADRRRQEVVPDVGEEHERVRMLRDRRGAASRRCWTGRSAGWRTALARPSVQDPHRMVDARAEEVTALLERVRRSLRHRLDRRLRADAHARARGGPVPRRDPEARYRRAPAADGHAVRDPAGVWSGEVLRRGCPRASSLSESMFRVGG
ncbi:exodeoxyribonuclease VII large subunit [Streptomyces heliomycini]